MKKRIINKLNITKSALFDQDDRNITKMLQKIALEETAHFIINNDLNSLYSVDSKYDLLKYALNHIENKGGLYLEFGVYKGDTINYIAKNIDTQIYGFDSFEGLPEVWRTGFGQGAFKISELPIVNNNVKLIQGRFDKTLPNFLKENNSFISFLHIDCDLYSSTKTIFNLLEGKISKGTVIVFDEYRNYSGWKEGEFKALQEFIEETKLNFQYIGYNSKDEQVAIIIL